MFIELARCFLTYLTAHVHHTEILEDLVVQIKCVIVMVSQDGRTAVADPLSDSSSPTTLFQEVRPDLRCGSGRSWSPLPI
jgi:hypothetical protein